MTYIERLLSISSEALTEKVTLAEQAVGNQWGLTLKSVLNRKNGFYAFEQSLHVFPSNSGVELMSLQRWNEPSTWKGTYDLDFGAVLFFAEDVFGNQFGIDQESVKRFDCESGAFEDHAPDLETWARIVLADYDFETGFSLSHEWQISNRPLRAGERLAPKTPFILGGEYTIENLYAADAVEVMRFRGDLYNQIKDTPDGTPIEIKVV